MRKESEFQQQQQKYEREREKVERENLNFGNQREKIWISVMWLPKFLLPKLAARAQKRNKIGEEKKIVAIVAMPLPKMGGGKNSSCRNLGRNQKKKNVTSTIFLQQITDE